MTFRREKIKDYFLLDTSVENLFINEYMAAAPGDFVKVYLFAQMYADLGQEITNEEIAKYLSMEHEDVLRAWTYWEKMGVIRKIRRESADKFDYDVEFVLLKEDVYKRQAVNCGIDRDAGNFYVSVTDDGVGISSEDLKHIFENFYRSPQTKKRRGGSGLGLSLSEQIIRGHGGKITVTSEEERGSCFVFSLPLFTEAV